MTTIATKPEQCVRAGELIPLAPGNLWIYRDAASGAKFEIRVIGMASVNRRLYHVVRGFGPEALMVRANDIGDLVAWDETHGVEKAVVPFDSGTSKAVEIYGRGGLNQGWTEEKPRGYEGPAGRWCVLEVTYRGTADDGPMETRERYAANVGLVQRVLNLPAGPLVFNLIYAQVGKQVIAAGEAGRFSLMAFPGADGRSWDVQLVAGPSGGLGLKFRFATDQQFDLRLRDADENVVWKWSANQHFMKNPQVLSAGGWSASVNVSHPPGKHSEEKSYVLEAWITVETNAPQFAAATTLRLAGSA